MAIAQLKLVLLLGHVKVSLKVGEKLKSNTNANITWSELGNISKIAIECNFVCIS